MSGFQRMFVFAVVLMVACSCTKNNEVARPLNTVIPVKLICVSVNGTNSSDRYIGTVQESQTIPMSFLATGMVEKVYVDEGQAVHKGQILAVLDSYIYENALEIATAKEKQAQDAYNRLSVVYKNGSLPEVKMVEIETALQQTHAMTLLAQKNLSDCNMVSPVSGIVGKRMIEPGSNVAPGITAITLVNIDKVFVKIPVPENEINKLKPGQEAVLKVGALNNAIYRGTIHQKGVIANPFSHSYEVKITVQNTDNALRPGMVCYAEIKNNVTNTMIHIPQQAVLSGNDGKKYVFIADTTQNKALRKNVITGSVTAHGDIEITEGLNAGDHVIVEGYHKISENSTISFSRSL
jgi:RND family efflux transporter MFP subunit